MSLWFRSICRGFSSISRENILTTATLGDIYDASVEMMKPLDTTERLDFDVSAIAFRTTAKTPTLLWRRIAGTAVSFSMSDSVGMGLQDESVIRVGVRYSYESVLSNLFGGRSMTIVRSAYARPRDDRLISMDGKTDDNGATSYFGS